MRTKVYIAGPIVKGPLEHNIRQATEAGMILLKAGYAPLVPHLSCYFDGPTPAVRPGGTVVEDWYGCDLSWVAVADCLLRLPGEGVGSDGEVALANSLHIPVYHNLETLMRTVMPTRPSIGDPRFKKLLDDTWELHCKKNSDYGSATDTFANYNRAESFGVPGYMSALLRLGEKMNRIETFCQKGALENEGIEDTLKDAAAISLIALLLYRKHTDAAAADVP